MEICKHSSCTGCGACSLVCPKKCIEMKEDEIGHLFPKIDSSLCVNCNACKNICPVNKKIYNRAQKAYACWALNNNERLNSTSGGIATILSKYFLNNGDIVYGSALYNNKICHIRVDNIEDIKLLQGSKYVESPILNVLEKIKIDLKNNKKVLFIGTPCQCSSVLSLCRHNLERLFLVELICTGVPPQKLLWEHLKLKEIDKIRFRDSIGTQLTVWKNKNIVYKKPIWKDLFLMGFSKHLYFRESCYNCKYASYDRVGDLTIGDFWGLGKLKPFKYDTTDGVSVVLTNNEKGRYLFESIKKNIFFEERLIEEAIQGNPRYFSPSAMHKNAKKFRILYVKSGFKKSITKCLKKERLKYFIYSKKRSIKKILKG